MRDDRAPNYLKLIDETLAMVATVCAATTTALEIQGVVSRAVVRGAGRRRLSTIDTSELGEGIGVLFRTACIREVGETDQLLAIPIEAACPFVGAVLIEKRPAGIRPRDRSMLVWLAKLVATIAPHVDITTSLDDELLAVRQRHAREALTEHGSILGAARALGMGRPTVRSLLLPDKREK